jgi:hypothetical protein
LSHKERLETSRKQKAEKREPKKFKLKPFHEILYNPLLDKKTPKEVLERRETVLD